ncbi:MAG: phage portal protein [Hyphomicrobiaceae bacterium]|nr:phage portal protein [Hyphomicrobiaceae bacterium]
MPLLPPAAGRVLTRFVNFARPPAEPDTKASRTGPLIAYETLGAPAWSGRDYSAFAREGYMSNAVVHRCVRMVAEAAASVPLILYDRRHEIEDHPLLDLLAHPTPNETCAGFLASVYSSLLVSGNAYVEAVAIGGQPPRELHLLRPDRMRVIPGPSGWPAAFEYTASGGSVRFDAEPTGGALSPILHLKLYHPLDDHYGHSPVEAAATAIDIHNQAARWNKALLDNAARPSGALVYAAREGRLSPEQFERLKTELQDGFQGAKNAGRPLLLEGGLDWKPLSLSPREMDFVETKHAAAREIALALGVPPMLLGIPGDNTYSNYQEATRALWRQTVLPLVERTAASLAGWLAPAYVTDDHHHAQPTGANIGNNIGSTSTPPIAPRDLRLVPDLDQIVALSSEREALWRQLETASFLTTDEKRVATGYTPLATPAITEAALPFAPHPRGGDPPG